MLKQKDINKILTDANLVMPHAILYLMLTAPRWWFSLLLWESLSHWEKESLSLREKGSLSYCERVSLIVSESLSLREKVSLLSWESLSHCEKDSLIARKNLSHCQKDSLSLRKSFSLSSSERISSPETMYYCITFSRDEMHWDAPSKNWWAELQNNTLSLAW